MGKRISLKTLIDAGIIKPPLKVRKTFRGESLTARIECDGSVTFLGNTYRTLSGAGASARAHVLRRKSSPPTSGWDFWRVADPKGISVPLADLRRKFLERRRGN
jgi:hypothetical protein